MKQTKIQHFMIDPPWPLGLVSRRHDLTTKLKLDYDVVPLSDIWKLLDKEIFSIAANIHHVYIWTLDKYIFDTEKRMINRGYKRHVITVWDKKDGAPPRVGTLRMYHEFMVWYYKPTLIRPARNMMGRLSTIMRESQREHSRKPECSYNMIERLYPNDTKMDVFSRQSRQGWHQFGNEKNYFPEFEKVLRI